VRLALSLSIALIAAAPAAATGDDLRSIAGMQSHNRVVLAFAPRLDDARMTAQRAAIARIGLQAAERDLVLVQVDPTRVIGASDTAARLRRRFGIAPDEFRAVVIGKDGRVALSSATAIDGARVVRLIDAMPMRQAERTHAAAAGMAAPR
jgi:hypothetical protein